MTKQLPVKQCQYCGGTDIGMGWQHGEALVTFKSTACSATACGI